METLIRSRRKTIAIEVKPDGEVVVRAPLRAAKRDIQRFIETHSDWIAKKQQQAQRYTLTKVPVTEITSQQFWYLGQTYPVRLIETGSKPVQFDNEFILAQPFLPAAANVFLSWYRRQAKKIIISRVEAFAKQYDFGYNGISITRATTRWGSCSGKGNLSFAWRLVMAPMAVIDYVVVHELAHLRELNHSAAFWQEVENILPDYKQRRQWLRQQGHKLDLPIKTG